MLAGVSQKMLTQTLRALERDGLITRTVVLSYELTDFGTSPQVVVRAIKSWAETHMDDVLAGRAAYDTRTG